MLTQESAPVNTVFHNILGITVTAGVVSICLYYVLRYAESIYVKYKKKPYFIHFYPTLKKLPTHLQKFLEENDFYKTLNKKRKQYFAHRAFKFLEECAASFAV